MLKSLQINQHERLYTILLAFGCFAFAVALAGYTIIGSFMRYSGDDYCYGAILQQQGFWKTQWYSYTNPTPYHGNRYSLTFLSSLSGLLVPTFSGVLPGLAIVLWILGLMWVIDIGGRLLFLRPSRLEGFLAAEILVFFTLAQAPDLSQSLYWRSGMLPYLAPLIANTFLIGFILKQLQRDRPHRLTLGLIAILSFFAGGFSETAAALQAGYLIVALLGTCIHKKKGGELAFRAILPLGAAMIGILFALLVLFISPANQARQMNLPTPPDLITVVRMSVRSAYIFTHSSVKRLLFSNVIIFASFLVLSFQIKAHNQSSISLRVFRFAGGLLLVPMIGFLLIVCCTAPSAYAQSSYPELRALITARFVLVVAAAVFGALVGQGAYLLLKPAYNKSGYWLSVSAILFGLMSIYPLFTAKNTLAEVPAYRKWATFWDKRDKEIRTAEMHGINDIEVVWIDSIIPRVGDLSPDPGYWYNNCAEGYYEMWSISANKSGWDDYDG